LATDSDHPERLMPPDATRTPPVRSPIRLTGVSHFFGAVEAVRDVSLEFAEGSFTALVGPSGCGKTTILRLIGGLEELQTSSLDRAPTATLGFAFQEPRLLPWRNIRDNVALPLELAGVATSERRARAHDALERVQLSDAALRFPHQLSGGMKMRAAIARALISRPRILLLDEPFGALDEVTRHELDLTLRNLWHTERCTTILVTHSIPEAAFLAERIVVLSPRPARVVAEITTPTLTRDAATWTHEELGACVRRASDALLRAIAESRA
jgi:NitT/TauT family transport system ATP-binding protein